MNFDDYRALEAVNFSTLKYLDRSPLHYLHALDHDRKDTSSLLRGRAAHKALLEPDDFERCYAVFPGVARRGKEWEAFKAAHLDEEGILKRDERDTALAIAAAVRRHRASAALLIAGHAEQTITWQDSHTGLECKARLDWFSDLALIDFKTTASVHARRFGALAGRMLYHVQLAWYSDGLHKAVGIRPPAKIIAAEGEAPHDVAVFALSDDDLFAGRQIYQGWLDRLVECRQSNVWPGRYPDEQAIEIPSWAFGAEEVDAPAFDEVETTIGAGL